MIHFILMLANVGEMTNGAVKMASYDPHGWTLSIVAVSVVFTGLILLFFVYSLSGRIFTKVAMPKIKHRMKKRRCEENAEVAAAIALALDMECRETDVAAAITAALHLYLTDCPHDIEPDKITIIPRKTSWNDRMVALYSSKL